MKKTYITTPIYYASGNVHIGNSYTTVAADVLARFKRMAHFDVYYLTGMDEHGQKIQEAAKKQGKTPQQLVDEVAENTKKTWQAIHITNDGFIRTSDPFHVQVVQNIFEKLLAQDDIYLSSYEGDYCVSCESFFTKTQIKEDGCCPDCGKKLIKVSEESYFFRLTKYQDKLLAFIKSHPDFIQPETRRNEVISFVESGLEDLSVSRSSFDWGIPIKSNPKHVVYVWLDALFNYLTALGFGGNDELYQKYWNKDTEIYQLVGKDILRFHAVYWPIFLMALGVDIDFKLYAHGWLLTKEGKMSKSVGNVVYPVDLANKYGVDALRYYLVKELPFGNDGVFTYDRFFERFNADLANDLGNLVSRTISMINKYFEGVIEKPHVNTPFDQEFENIINEKTANAIKEYHAFHLQNAVTEAMAITSRANKYIDETKPWELAKDEAKKEELKSVMYHLAEAIRIVNILLSPVLVEASPKIVKYLNIFDCDLNDATFGFEYQNKVIEKAEPLFKRLDVMKEMKELEG